MVQTDLGQFDEELFNGFCWNNISERRLGSSVYDWYLDTANERIIAITGTETAVFQFTSGWAATDNDNSYTVLSPIGPKALSNAYFDFDDRTADTSSENYREFSHSQKVQNSIVYDPDNKRLWYPLALPIHNVGTNDYDCTAAILTYDMEQLAAFGSIELVVTTADASNVTCWANQEVEYVEAHGLGRDFVFGGQWGDGWYAVTDDYLIHMPLTGHLLDVLIEKHNLSLASSTTYPQDYDPDNAAWQGRFQNRSIGRTKTDDKAVIYRNDLQNGFNFSTKFASNNGMVFQIEQADQVDSTQTDNYIGPFFRRDNLKHDLLYFCGSSNSSLNHGASVLITSEGWWAVGNMRYFYSIQSSHGTCIGVHFKPSSRIEHHGSHSYASIGWLELNERQMLDQYRKR